MAKLEIIEIPNPILRQKSIEVEEVNAEILKLLDDMLETMYHAPGVGLAGPQVGVLKRLVVIDVSGKDEPDEPRYFINPEIIWKSEETEECEEGCLSVPKQFAKVVRSAKIKVRYLNRDGEVEEILAEDMLAIALQHEIDHLDGKIFIDYLSPLKRNMLLRRLEKERRFSANADEN